MTAALTVLVLALGAVVLATGGVFAYAIFVLVRAMERMLNDGE